MQQVVCGLVPSSELFPRCFPSPCDLALSEENYPWRSPKCGHQQTSILGSQTKEWPQGLCRENFQSCYRCSRPGSSACEEPGSHQAILPPTINRTGKQCSHLQQFASLLPCCSPAPWPKMCLSLQQILKLCPKKKSSSTYTFCKSVGLLGMQFHLFENECKSIAPASPGKGEGGWSGLCHPVSGHIRREMPSWLKVEGSRLRLGAEDSTG